MTPEQKAMAAKAGMDAYNNTSDEDKAKAANMAMDQAGIHHSNITFYSMVDVLFCLFFCLYKTLPLRARFAK